MIGLPDNDRVELIGAIGGLAKAYHALRIPNTEDLPHELGKALAAQILADGFSRNQYQYNQPNGQIAATFSSEDGKRRLSTLNINYKVPVALSLRVKNALRAGGGVGLVVGILSLGHKLSINQQLSLVGGAALFGIIGGATWWGIRSWSEFNLKQNEDGSFLYEKKFGGALRSAPTKKGWVPC